ncbi:MAG: heme NO-binding domain-containing protein, partial [Bacteroidota bacterium]
LKEMKGSIPDALQELIKKHHGGPTVWMKILEHAGLPKDFKIYSHKDVPDETVKNLIESSAVVLGITYDEAADAFGDHWMNEYAPLKYFAFFNRPKTAKEFLMEMNRVHEKITAKVENAKPPHFEYQTPDRNTLIMTYESDRGLYPIFVGLVKAVGKYYKEEIKVLRSGDNSVKVSFNYG